MLMLDEMLEVCTEEEILINSEDNSVIYPCKMLDVSKTKREKLQHFTRETEAPVEIRLF